MHRQAVGKQSELFFKEFRPPVCFLRGKSVAVAVDRAGTRVPEIPDILRGVAKLAVASKNGFDGGDYERIIVVVRLDPAEKYQQQHLVPTENRGSTLLFYLPILFLLRASQFWAQRGTRLSWPDQSRSELYFL